MSKRLCISGFIALVTGLTFCLSPALFAQGDDLEISFDLSSASSPVPAIFKPNIDLSGRGFNRELSWPQNLASRDVLDAWQKDLGFSGVYRLQYNLWEINDLAKNRQLQQQLLNNYESVIKRINDAGGVVILDIFGTPAGLGKVLDKRSPPWDLKAFKELIKSYIKYLSCVKKYNVWYEVWSAPDLDDFFLGRKQEYLNLYRVVAESAKELEEQYKINIPVGGPSVTWWFQSLEGNAITTPEQSLIYDLIRFCSRYRLPLDFISWHAYTTDPQIDRELTSYGKGSVSLIRDWLSYFNLDKNTPLVVDEWNYDSGANILPERQQKSNVASSFIMKRLKSMYEAGLDYQLYFCLEDFQNNKEGVARNVGIFWFEPDSSRYKGAPKPGLYNLFKALGSAGDGFFPLVKSNDEFVGVNAFKGGNSYTIFAYNYIDTSLALNYISRNVASLNASERRALLSLVNSEKIYPILRREAEFSKLKLSARLKSLLKKACDLNDRAAKFSSSPRSVNLSFKNLKSDYVYQRCVINESSAQSNDLPVTEQKDIPAGAIFKDTLSLSPYSVSIISLKVKPKPAEAPPAAAPAQDTLQQAANVTIQAVNATAVSAQQNLTAVQDKK